MTVMSKDDDHCLSSENSSDHRSIDRSIFPINTTTGAPDQHRTSFVVQHRRRSPSLLLCLLSQTYHQRNRIVCSITGPANSTRQVKVIVISAKNRISLMNVNLNSRPRGGRPKLRNGTQHSRLSPTLLLKLVLVLGGGYFLFRQVLPKSTTTTFFFFLFIVASFFFRRRWSTKVSRGIFHQLLLPT